MIFMLSTINGVWNAHMHGNSEYIMQMFIQFIWGGKKGKSITVERFYEWEAANEDTKWANYYFLEVL